MSYIFVRASEALLLMVNPDCPNRLLTEHIRRQIMKEGPEELVQKAIRGAPPESRFIDSDYSLQQEYEDEDGEPIKGQTYIEKPEDNEESTTPHFKVGFYMKNKVYPQEDLGKPTKIDLITEKGELCGLYFYQDYENPFELGLVKEGATYIAVSFEYKIESPPKKPNLLLTETYPNYDILRLVCQKSIPEWIAKMKEKAELEEKLKENIAEEEEEEIEEISMPK